MKRIVTYFLLFVFVLVAQAQDINMLISGGIQNQTLKSRMENNISKYCNTPGQGMTGNLKFPL